MNNIIIFADIKFSNDFKNDPISVGLVSSCERHSFYREFDDFKRGLCSPYVIDNDLPLLGSTEDVVRSRHQVREDLREWLGQFEAYQIQMMFGHENDWHPFCDFLLQVPPNVRCTVVGHHIHQEDLELFFKENNLHPHHALHDARANRFAFFQEWMRESTCVGNIE